jgi:hypothetical protein
MKTILLWIAVLTWGAIALVARTLSRNAAAPPLGDPKNATPPPARDINQSERRDERAVR